MKYRYVVRRRDLDDPSDYDVFVKMARQEFAEVITTVSNILYFTASPLKLQHACRDRGLSTLSIDILTTDSLEPSSSN